MNVTVWAVVSRTRERRCRRARSASQESRSALDPSGGADLVCARRTALYARSALSGF